MSLEQHITALRNIYQHGMTIQSGPVRNAFLCGIHGHMIEISKLMDNAVDAIAYIDAWNEIARDWVNQYK